MSTRTLLPDNLDERAFQQLVVELAQWHGWRLFHPLTMRNVAGRYLTAFVGDSGFPDLVLVHPTRCPHGPIYAELKTAKGRLSNGQQLWRADLEASGAEYYVWRPADFPNIQNRLKGPNK